MGTLYRRKPGGNWQAEFTDATGERIQKSTGTKNKAAATKVLTKLEQDSNNSRFGISDANISIDELLAEYLAYLGNSSSKHSDHTEKRLQKINDAAGFLRPADITQLGVETAVRNLKHHQTGEKLSLRTQSHYLAAFKSFTKWLTNVRLILNRDPLLAVRKPNFSHDRRLIRRFLLPEEWKWLAKSPHAILYETAIQTGLRSSELATLTPASLDADHLFVPAKHTKNKQDAQQYITASLASRLKSVLPFNVPNDKRLAELLRRDLSVSRWYAGNESGKLPDGFLLPTDAKGHVLDFHALRHTCGAWLAIEGVTPKVIQKVMRHSSITLTLDTYGHLMPGAEKDIIKHFRKLMDD